MKTLIGFGVFALIIVCSCSNQKRSKRASDLIGTYEYTGNLEGISIWNENHFVWATKIRMNKPDSILTPEERYNSVNSAAGTWSLKDSIITCIFTYHKNPKLIGTSFQYVFDLKGNEFNYRFIDKEGKVTRKGSAIKIK